MCNPNVGIMEYITEAIDNGEDVDIVYVDFCKAFNKVPHVKLLHKLYKFGTCCTTKISVIIYM